MLLESLVVGKPFSFESHIVSKLRTAGLRIDLIDYLVAGSGTQDMLSMQECWNRCRLIHREVVMVHPYDFGICYFL